MKNIKLLLTFLLLFSLVFAICSCAYPPSENPPQERPGEEIEGDGTGEKDDTGTPEDEKKPDSGDVDGGENTPPEGDGDNPPPAGDDNQGETDGSDENLAAYLQKIKDDLDIMGLVNLSEEEQVIFVASFEEQSGFFEWYFAALEKYKEENPGVDFDGGDFDLFG